MRYKWEKNEVWKRRYIQCYRIFIRSIFASVPRQRQTDTKWCRDTGRESHRVLLKMFARCIGMRIFKAKILTRLNTFDVYYCLLASSHISQCVQMWFHINLVVFGALCWQTNRSIPINFLAKLLLLFVFYSLHSKFRVFFFTSFEYISMWWMCDSDHFNSSTQKQMFSLPLFFSFDFILIMQCQSMIAYPVPAS